MTKNTDRRAIVDLLPQFLTRALRGWDGLAPLLAVAGVARLTYFLLRALVQERDAGDGITREEMLADLFNPYSTMRPILAALPALVERGYVANASGRYSVTRDGREFITHVESEKDRYLALLMPIPAAEIARLAGELMVIARRLRDAPEPERKPHQARAWRVMPPADAAPMVRLYGAVYALWMARDDCHNAAWRAAGFDGPAFDLLSRVWSGNATTAPALTEAVREFQRPEDVERGIAALEVAGYLTRNGE
ncbi:MAG TPA: hypothetical protein VIG44_04060, partial [Thermomicrobiales bacterium]